MSINVSTLKTELFSSVYTQPIYSAATTARDVSRLAFLLNTVSAVEASNTCTVGTVDALAMQQCVVVAEYLTLTNQQRDLWNALVTTATQGLSISNTLIRAQVLGIWSAGLSSTRSNLAAIQTRPCTRAEALSGEGAVADENNIYVALTQ